MRSVIRVSKNRREEVYSGNTTTWPAGVYTRTDDPDRTTPSGYIAKLPSGGALYFPLDGSPPRIIEVAHTTWRRLAGDFSIILEEA